MATGLHGTLNKETQTPQFISGTGSGIKLCLSTEGHVYSMKGVEVWSE